MQNKLLKTMTKNRGQFVSVVPKALLRKPHREINLAEEVLRFFQRHPRRRLNFKNLVNPYKYHGLENEIHRELGLDWSYGGYLENRSVIFQHTYLKETQCWLHLGIDINIPVGAEVLAALDGTVFHIGSDYPEKGGWGNFVILEHKLDGVVFYSIYGHLSDKVLLAINQRVRARRIVGWVGKVGENGFWRPHTHVQFISKQEMRLRWNPFTLDGYGPEKDLDYLQENYPDPLMVISMR